MDNTLHLRCLLNTTVSRNIPFEIDGKQKYTQDPGSMHLLKQGLLFCVHWSEGEASNAAFSTVTVTKVPIDSIEWPNGVSTDIENLGYKHMQYVWVSPQAVRNSGEAIVLRELPRAIKKERLHQEMKEFCRTGSSVTA